MPTAPHRLLRSTIAALVAAAGGTGAHLLAGGDVHPVGLLGFVLMLTALAWTLAGRERDWLSLAVAQLLGQQLTHAVLALLGTSALSLLPHDLMLYLHLVAALLAAGWLRAGERRAFAAIGRLIAACAVPLPPRPRPALGTRPVTADGPAGPDAGWMLRHLVVRRGPPPAG